MATLHIENVPDELYERFQKLAIAQKDSISTQVLMLLEKALLTEKQPSISEEKKKVLEILARIRNRRESRPIIKGMLDSTTLLREDRNR
jgi:antitoxin FitA